MQYGSSCANPFELNAFQSGRLQKYGFDVPSNTIEEAIRVLVASLQSEIEDISDAYSLTELLDVYDAIFGECEVKYVDEGKPPKKVVVVAIGGTIPHNRKKIRIDLTKDSSYAIPLYEHLSSWKGLEVSEIKTGMAVKFLNGNYKSNVFNYNELRTIYGELHGNLYFNMVKSDQQFQQLGIDLPYEWFRSFVVIRNISIWDVIKCLKEATLNYLIGLNTVANKRRQFNKRKLIKNATDDRNQIYS